MSVATPLVSILIPTYNSGAWLKECLDSALAQTHPHVEIIVTDNASTDTTWAIIQEYSARFSSIKGCRNTENIGPLANWIRGLDHCQGMYVKILFSDDWIAPTFVERAVALLDRDPKAALVFTGTALHFPAKREEVYKHQGQLTIQTSDYILRTILGENMPVSPGCALIRKRDAHFQKAFGGDMRLAEIAARYGAGPDVLFMLNAAARYPHVAHIPEVLAHFRGHEGSTTLAHRRPVNEGYRLAYRYLLRTGKGALFYRVRWRLRICRVLRYLSRLTRSFKRCVAK